MVGTSNKSVPERAIDSMAIQEPKLEVPTIYIYIYGLFFRPRFQGISHSYGQTYGQTYGLQGTSNKSDPEITIDNWRYYRYIIDIFTTNPWKIDQKYMESVPPINWFLAIDWWLFGTGHTITSLFPITSRWPSESGASDLKNRIGRLLHPGIQ